MVGVVSQNCKACLAAVLLSLLYCAVFLSLRIYPFVDLPNHLAAATIFRYYGDHANAFSDFFSVSLSIRPNLSHLLLCGFDIFPSVEYANKIFYCLYIVLLPFSVFLAIKKINGNLWCGFFAFLFLYNFNVSYGFTGFMFSIPVVLLFFYFLQCYREKISFAHFCAVAAILVSLYFFHILSALYALLLFSLCRLYDYSHKPKHIWKDIVTISPLVFLLIMWVYAKGPNEGQSTVDFFINYYSSTYLRVLPLRLSLFFVDNFFLYEGLPGYALGTAFTCCILVPVGYGLFAARKAQRSEIVSCGNYQVLILVVSSLLLFLFLPQDIPDTVHLFYQRFSVFFFLGLILMLSRLLAVEIIRVPPVFFVSIALVHFLLWGGYFFDFNRQNASFTPDFFPSCGKQQTLAGMMLEHRFRGRSIYKHFPDYFITWKQGIATTFLIDSGFGSFGSTTRKAPKKILPVYDYTLADHRRYDARYNHMDYLLVRGTIPEGMKEMLHDFTVVKSEDMWLLLKRDTIL